MRVLFLGAGASKCAGYPLASDLIPAIKSEAENSNLANLKNAWQTWKQFLDTQRGALALLLNNPNPEVILSAVDLCEMIRPVRGSFKQKYAEKAWSYILSRQPVPKDWWRSAGHRVLFQAGNARNRFRDCLAWFFTFKHQDDSESKSRDRRDYLRRLLDELRKGDVVITLNWDTTVERSLEELDRWNTANGYGFEKSLRLGTRDCSRPLPRRLSRRRSEVLVLKLHGSHGWHQTRGGKIYFNNYYFLPYFNFRHNGLPLFDPEGPTMGPDNPPLIAYPSFLKQLGGTEMQEIWYRAGEALNQADQIDVWGYSLPESDTAIRALLNPLRFRLKRRSVQVAVHEPYSGEVRDRWRSFLGCRRCVDSQALGCR